jgi:pimeloyl-ACP methyl ester carboxylesterase
MELSKISRVKLDDNISVFYRYAGSPEKPVLLLIHGYPNSSTYYRDLMTLLSPYYRTIAPDLPGFGFTTVDTDNYEFTFANGASVLSRFIDALAVKKFAMYIFDFGAPWGLRLALQRPNDVTAIISQNGNCYVDGLGKPWDAMREYWRTNSEAGREALTTRVRTLERAKAQYVDGTVANGDIIDPVLYHLDHALLQRPKILEAMLSYFWDYQTNVELYPEFQKYLREKQPPVLAVWGKNDVSFTPGGAEAFKRDLRTVEVHLLDAGHFALAGLEEVFAGLIRRFLAAHIEQ